MKPRSKKLPSHPALARELHLRLAELETEISRYPERKTADRTLKSVANIQEETIGVNKAIAFSIGKGSYAVGHTDKTYAGSHHARGVRYIRFYSAGEPVLVIEGDFEAQQFGLNFRFQNIDLYVPGDWEADLVKLTDTLRVHADKRKARFKKKRDAERDRRPR